LSEGYTIHNLAIRKPVKQPRKAPVRPQLVPDYPPPAILPDMRQPPPASKDLLSVVIVPDYAPPPIASPHHSLTLRAVTTYSVISGLKCPQSKQKMSTRAACSACSFFLLWAQEETSCQRKKLPVTGRNILSKEETSSQRKEFPVIGRNLLSHEETSWHRQKLTVTGRKFLSHEATSYHRKKLPIT
jgi:hypothetical protein